MVMTKPKIRTGARAASPKPVVPAKTTVTTGAVAKPKGKAPTKGLVFTHNGHRYRLDGLPVTGVTTILGGGIPKPALVRWAPRVVAEWVTDPANRERLEELLAGDTNAAVRELAGLPNQIRDAAAVQGTTVHGHAEVLATTGEVGDVPTELVGFVEAYAALLDDWQLTAVLTERPVANRADWWSGTFDMLATSPLLMTEEEIAAGCVIQIDIKTSNGVYGEVALQTAAYSKAEFYMDKDGNEQPMPSVVKTYVAHVRDGVANLYPLAGSPAEIDRHYQLFLAAAFTHKTTKEREEIIGEPLAIPAVAA